MYLDLRFFIGFVLVCPCFGWVICPCFVWVVCPCFGWVICSCFGWVIFPCFGWVICPCFGWVICPYFGWVIWYFDLVYPSVSSHVIFLLFNVKEGFKKSFPILCSLTQLSRQSDLTCLFFRKCECLSHP